MVLQNYFRSFAACSSTNAWYFTRPQNSEGSGILYHCLPLSTDLLQHREYERTTDQALPYPRVEWFDHCVPDCRIPPDSLAYQAMLEQSPLYWPLPDKEEPSPRRRLKLPRIHRTQVAQLSKPVAQSNTTKLPPV